MRYVRFGYRIGLMPNTIKERPLDPIFYELQQMGVKPNGPLWEYMRTLVPSTDKTITSKGEIQSKANVTGRTEQLSLTLGNITAIGQLNNADNIAADGVSFGRVIVSALSAGAVDLAKAGVVGKTTDNLSDGTGSPLTGGKRGFVALDTNNRLANSFRANPVNVSSAPQSSTTLSNDGISTATSIASYINQFPAGTVSVNSGSVDLGSFGSQIVYFDDPTFAGGAVAYQVTTTVSAQTAAEGRTVAGQITSVGGSAKTGGGTSGGTGGKAGGRGFIQG